MENLEDLKKQFEELAKRITDFGIKLEEYGIEKQKINGRWKAGYGERYYLVDEFEKKDLSVGTYTLENEGYNIEFGDTTDEFYYKTRNYFKTKEEAAEYKEKLKTYYDLVDLADELNGDRKIDWKNSNQRKYYICYNNYDDSLEIECVYGYKGIGQIYSLDENFLDIALERIGKDRLKKLFKEV